MNSKFKVNFNFYTNLIILFLLIFGGAVWADSNGVWHFPEDIRPGIFGSDEGDSNSEYTFVNPIYSNNTLYVSSIVDSKDSNYSLNLSGISTLSNVTFENFIGQLNLNSVIKVGFENINCNVNKKGILRYNSTGNIMEYCNSSSWVVMRGSNIDGISGTGDGLVWLGENGHTEQDCIDLGGEFAQVYNAKLCRVFQSSCPSGWSRYGNWASFPSKIFYNSWPCNSAGGFSDIICEATAKSWADTLEGNSCYGTAVNREYTCTTTQGGSDDGKVNCGYSCISYQNTQFTVTTPDSVGCV